MILIVFFVFEFLVNTKHYVRTALRIDDFEIAGE